MRSSIVNQVPSLGVKKQKIPLAAATSVEANLLSGDQQIWREILSNLGAYVNGWDRVAKSYELSPLRVRRIGLLLSLPPHLPGISRQRCEAESFGCTRCWVAIVI